MNDAANVHDHLVVSGNTGNRGRLAGNFVFGQVDSRIDHVHSFFRYAFLVDNDPLHRLTRRDHRGRVAQDLSFKRSIDLEKQSAPQPVSFGLVAEQRVSFVDHRPPVAPASERSSRRSAVVLGVHQFERMLAGDFLEARPTEPRPRRNSVDRRVFKLAPREGDSPRRPRAQMRHHNLHAAGLERAQDLDRQHGRAVVVARNRERNGNHDPHGRWLHPGRFLGRLPARAGAPITSAQRPPGRGRP